jgi:hypothetical protein
MRPRTRTILGLVAGAVLLAAGAAGSAALIVPLLVAGCMRE